MTTKSPTVASLKTLRSFRIRLGFVPLLDSAPLIVAHELGFFRDENLDVELVRENSWASLRDKVSFGLLDGAHMLAPMPIAMAMASDRPKVPITVGLVLSRNGNGITVSRPLYQSIVDNGGCADKPVTSAQILADLATRRGHPIQLASVAPWSSHDLQLRDWIDSLGTESPDCFSIVPVPPTRMIDAFRSGTIEGCCVGEPWNSLLEQEGLGTILHSGHQIWPNAPEKVLGMRSDWADQHPDVHEALLRALIRACRWLDESVHSAGLKEMLASEQYLGSSLRKLGDERFHLFHPSLNQHFFAENANFPWLSQAHWLTDRLSQRQILDVSARQQLGQIYRPDIYRRTAESMGLPLPTQSENGCREFMTGDSRKEYVAFETLKKSAPRSERS